MPPSRFPSLRASQERSAPKICVPLMSRTLEALRDEARTVSALRPDVIEWRADHFESLADATQVAGAALELRAALGRTPLLFTRRSPREGGAPSTASDTEVMAACERVVASAAVDAIDCELSQPEADIRRLRELTRAGGVAQILSFHDFAGTPENAALLALAARAAALGADAVKIAVMPQSLSDVLRLLDVTRQLSERGGIPVISMAMGEAGRLSRVAGGLFGSAMTFASGASASAPGQMDVESLRAAMRPLYAG